MRKKIKVGVIGAGTMGQGIAQAFAMKDGYEVVLCDVSMEVADSGKQKIGKVLQRLVRKEKMEAVQATLILDRITAGIVRNSADCGLIVEAVAEQMEMKKSLFRELSEICQEDTIFTTNTSSLSITEISRSSSRAVIGMHFFNPVPVMELVEVVRGADTPSQLVKQVKEIAFDIGKVPVEVAEQPGFVVNRILIPMINEAIGVLAAGTASAEDIDTAMKLGASHPIGPLALGDLVGLDVCLAIMEVILNETGDPRYRPEPLLRKMVRAGLLGRKTGAGFFKYK